jgi:hypothetical protein
MGEDIDRELPQYNRFLREFDPRLMLEKACKVLAFDLKTAQSAPRIAQRDKEKRDLLIFLLWQAGRGSGPAIGEYFGLSYSAISRRAKIMNERIIVDQKVRRQYEELKSLIKV